MEPFVIFLIWLVLTWIVVAVASCLRECHIGELTMLAFWWPAFAVVVSAWLLVVGIPMALSWLLVRLR